MEGGGGLAPRGLGSVTERSPACGGVLARYKPSPTRSVGSCSESDGASLPEIGVLRVVEK